MRLMRLLSIAIFLFPLCGVAQMPVKNKQPFSSSLRLLLKGKNIRDGDSIAVIIAFKDNVSFRIPIRPIAKYKQSNVVAGKIAIKDLKAIDDTNIVFIDQLRNPKEELTSGAIDYTLNKIRKTQANYPKLNGEGIIASVKEQSFDAADIDFKNRVIKTPNTANTVSSHASLMTTIIGGGGNSSLEAKGVAPSPTLSSSDFATLLPDADSIYKAYNISIQNHSYGTGIENYYGADASAYDMSVWQNKKLVHVFSAGNSGTGTATDDAFQNVQGFANLTGSFKMAKNIITVGHVDSFNTVLLLSSKGPAFDGRIKPELVAFGADGSSGAAALVSGTAVLLQQAYKKQHNNAYPSAQLVKAALINSADDVGTPHIDYASGYGSLNAYRAVQTVILNHFFEGQVKQDETKTFALSIPDKAAVVKITLAWTDTPAIANTSKALINDLDVSVTSASGERWLPWALSSYPNKDSLFLPASRKLDTLNNVEQITIELPKAGVYSIEVKGRSLKTSAQDFALAWQIDTINQFVWMYPSSSDPLKASEENIIRWETNKKGSATLQYSINDNHWLTIADNIEIGDQYYRWMTPDLVASAQLRLIDSDNKPFSSDQFMLTKPIELKVGFDCDDSLLLYWNKISSSRYKLYELGEKYLEPVLTTNDTLVVLKKGQHAALHYAIAPVLKGKEGQRSVTINYTNQGVGCYLKSFLVIQQNNDALLNAELGSVYNISSIEFQKINATDTQTIKVFTELITTSFYFTDPALTKGVNSYRLVIKLKEGTQLASAIESIYFFNDFPVLIYPNPAKQREPVRLIVKDPFVYSIQVFDATGRLIHTQVLSDLTNQFSSLYLPKGFYFIKIISEAGVLKTQKLIVQ